MQVKNISHVHINCSDLQRSAAFYSLLGFQLERVIGGDSDAAKDINNVPIVTLPQGQTRTIGMGLGTDPRTITKLELIEWVSPKRKTVDIPPDEQLGVVRIALSIKGIEECVERVRAAGYRVTEPSVMVISDTLSSHYCDLYDPDGTWLSLLEWIRR
ncbi:MAG: VOC family protein [Gammaproteobacteria bacterium]|nr:VOC family protein [Gammaproteobacteria bacterium]